MLMKDKIKQFIKKYPKFHVYYHDNGAWVIYSSKKDYDADTGEEHKKPVLEGADYDSFSYLPELVEAMVELLGGSADSV